MCALPMPLSRPTWCLENSAWGSGFPRGQEPLGCDLLLSVTLAGHWLNSDVDSGDPVDCVEFVVTVELEAMEPLEEIEEEEPDRCKVFLGTSMPLASSVFAELVPLIVPHAGREI